jgi:hypothetical protein
MNLPPQPIPPRGDDYADLLADPEPWPGDHCILDMPDGVTLLAESVDLVIGRLAQQQRGGRPCL